MNSVTKSEQDQTILGSQLSSLYPETLSSYIRGAINLGSRVNSSFTESRYRMPGLQFPGADVPERCDTNPLYCGNQV